MNSYNFFQNKFSADMSPFANQSKMIIEQYYYIMAILNIALYKTNFKYNYLNNYSLSFHILYFLNDFTYCTEHSHLN